MTQPPDPNAHAAARSTAPSPSALTADERLSALMDGQADEDAVRAVCRAWRDDSGGRQTWHAYHLIGDVLRSQELASPPGHDAAFLARLRERLVAEPVVLAPAPLPVPVVARRRLRWMAPGAIAAGFVAVAGAVIVSQMEAPGLSEGGPVLATTPPVTDAVRRASVGGPAAAAPVVPAARATPASASEAGRAMIRDPEIDRYFRAHREMRGWAGAAVPGGGPRPVDNTVPAR